MQADFAAGGQTTPRADGKRRAVAEVARCCGPHSTIKRRPFASVFARVDADQKVEPKYIFCFRKKHQEGRRAGRFCPGRAE